MEYKELRELALAAMDAPKGAAVAYSFGEEQFSSKEVNEVLRAEFNKLAGDYRSYRENKNTIFRLIEETIDEVLPKKVNDAYMQFAEVKTIPQGDKAVFKLKVTEASKKRAKTFVTKVGLAGRYETFKLDGTQLEVAVNAIGAAARIEFEEFLDGRWEFSDFTDLIIEGMNDYIYKEIADAFVSLETTLPRNNKAQANAFDEATMDELLAIADSYAHAAIYCTYEFAATMLPSVTNATSWISESMKDRRWAEGYLGDYKGHQVIILPQSMDDATNTTKAIKPNNAYIIPVGSEKPVKLVFEGQTAVREVEDNDDWSRDLQTYKKFGVALLSNNWICLYQNTSLKTSARTQNLWPEN